LKHTVFNDVQFESCKLLGLHFNDCDDLFLSMSFDNCNLELSVFYNLTIKKSLFKNCILKEVDFTHTNMSQSSFLNCDFKNAIFEQTNLEQADLRSSFNFFIDPQNNSIKKARFSKDNLAGLLYKYQLKIES